MRLQLRLVFDLISTYFAVFDISLGNAAGLGGEVSH